MELKVIGSSSQGNCYILEGKDSSLIIEAGVPFKKVKPVIDFKISKIAGVIASHSHGDHSGFIGDYLSYSIPVYSSKETFQEITHTKLNHNCISVEALKKFSIGDFTIMPFELKHDVKCFGYLIRHKEMGTMLFATDTYYIPNTFPGLNHILIEANYDKNLLSSNISSGKVHPVVRKRVLSSHMEIGTTDDMLKANDLSKVKNIVLIHLSSTNSNASEFKKRIQQSTGIPTYIAEKNLTINLNF